MGEVFPSKRKFSPTRLQYVRHHSRWIQFGVEEQVRREVQDISIEQIRE